jgi:hypothetical protein
MKNVLAVLALMSMLVIIVTGCGSTPTPTSPPPTPTQEAVVPTESLPTPTQEAAAPTSPPPTPTQEAAAPTEPPTEPPSTVPPTETPEPTPEPTSAPVRPTTPSQPSVKYEPPTLLNPPNDVPISWNYSVLMEWSDVGDLEEDEYYHLHLDAVREVTGEPWYGDYIFTKETSYRAEEKFLEPFHPPAAQGRAVVTWWVRVVRKTGVDENGKPLGVDISAPSEKRTFITQSKPDE